MHREKFPERVPFRLTRMMTKAMEVSGIEGNFRWAGGGGAGVAGVSGWGQGTQGCQRGQGLLMLMLPELRRSCAGAARVPLPRLP
jgi:hypothetical protein